MADAKTSGPPRRRGTGFLVGLGILIAAAAVPSAWLYWTYRNQPLQPLHHATATVVRIEPTMGRSENQTVVVRNAQGFGRIPLMIGTFRCRVGDVVPVDQRGATLLPVPSKCR